MKRIFTNCTIVAPEGVARGHILTVGPRIEAVVLGDESPLPEVEGAEVVDLQGDTVMPGVIDAHVHFREPGMTDKGTMASESAAALLGGVTSVLEMPNTRPATDSRERWQWKMDRAAETCRVNYGFFIGATADNLAELRAMDYTRCPGVKVFMGASTGSLLLDDDAALRRIFEAVDAPVVVHAEDAAEIARAERAYSGAREVPIERHSDIRSAEACFKASQRAVAAARATGSRLHIAHLSTAPELRLLSDAPLADKRITAETCPQYLLLSTMDYPQLGARMKCNPAVKTHLDREALQAAVLVGLIDSIATDHAPHPLSAKEGDALHAASGMPGVQFALPLMLTLYGDPALVARKMSTAPATIFGIRHRGAIAPGYYADLAIVRPLEKRRTITDDEVVSPCGWTPYAGRKVGWQVTATVINGVTASPSGLSSAMALEFDHS